MVTPASASGSPAGLKASPSPSVISASISTGRNRADAGIVKTRGLEVMAAAFCHRPFIRANGNRWSCLRYAPLLIRPGVGGSVGAGPDRRLGRPDGVGCADMHPDAFETQPM